MNLLDDIFPTAIHMPKTEIVCKSYDPWEVNVPTYPKRGPHDFWRFIS